MACCALLFVLRAPMCGCVIVAQRALRSHSLSAQKRKHLTEVWRNSCSLDFCLMGHPAGQAASAAKPAPTFSQLSHLTAQSARIGRWEVLIFTPMARTREYRWEGKTHNSSHFQCMLVLTADPTVYVLGNSHGKGMLAAALKHG